MTIIGMMMTALEILKGMKVTAMVQVFKGLAK